MRYKLGLAVSGSVLLGSLLLSGTALAQTPPPQNQNQGSSHAAWSRSGQAPGVVGTVSSISGDTLTVTSRGFGQNSTQTTYTVDASNATVTKDGSSSSVSDISVGDTVMIQGTVSGTSVTATKINDGMMGGNRGMMGGQGVFGTVASISGTTLTVSSKGFGKDASVTTTYTVDASNATVTKDGSASSVGSIAVGDTVMIQGAVSGTSVTATKINDGMMGGNGNDQMPAMQGNGEPVVGGTVSAISGTTLTITNQGNETYTIDASNASVMNGNASSTVSSIAVGDSVLVQGEVNGNSVTASSILIQVAPKSSNNANGKPGRGGFMGGLMGGIGNFFQHLFGFF